MFSHDARARHSDWGDLDETLGETEGIEVEEETEEVDDGGLA